MNDEQETCGLCLHPKSDHVQISQSTYCCDGCGGFMTHAEFADNPTYWSVSSSDGLTILDSNERVRKSREVLGMLKRIKAEHDRLTAELADATATLHKQSGMANEINILTKENRQLRDRLADAREQIDQFNADKVALEELFVIDGRFAPDYESGWNDAIAKAIEKFGRNALFQENEELLGKLAEAREQIAAYEAVLQKIANEDYRGNRSPASQLAYDALKAGKQDVPQSKMAGPSQGINETRVTHECEVSVTE